jgi:hypothetical protein
MAAHGHRTHTFTRNFHCGVDAPRPLLACPRHAATGNRSSTDLKENVMNEAPQLEIVELGDAKEQTKGTWITFKPENNPDYPYQPKTA